MTGAWLAVVDTGELETLRYLLEDMSYARAKRRALDLAAPARVLDVFVISADDPARGPLDPNRCAEESCDGEEHHEYEPATNGWNPARRCPFAVYTRTNRE